LGAMAERKRKATNNLGGKHRKKIRDCCPHEDINKT